MEWFSRDRRDAGNGMVYAAMVYFINKILGPREAYFRKK